MKFQNTRENLKNHAAEKLGNQFFFMHIDSDQVVLFLYRFAIRTAPGERNPKEMPKPFLAEAAPAALDAASQISILINDATEYHAVAPFLSYCAFMSSTTHVWGIFSKNKSIEASCKKHLASNVKYLGKMKHWGMFHFMAENLNDISVSMQMRPRQYRMRWQIMMILFFSMETGLRSIHMASKRQITRIPLSRSRRNLIAILP